MVYLQLFCLVTFLVIVFIIIILVGWMLLIKKCKTKIYPPTTKQVKIFWRLFLSSAFFFLSMFIATYVVNTLMLFSNWSEGVYIYLCLSLFFSIALILEYAAPYANYKFLKDVNEKLRKTLGGDIFFWILVTLANSVYDIPRKNSIRLQLYVGALVTVVVTSVFKIQGMSADNWLYDVLDRAVVTFIAVERITKYVYDRWFDKSKEVEIFKKSRVSAPLDFFGGAKKDVCPVENNGNKCVIDENKLNGKITDE